MQGYNTADVNLRNTHGRTLVSYEVARQRSDLADRRMWRMDFRHDGH
jgi:hypothetical protein